MKLSTRAKYGLKALIDLGLYSEKEAVSLQSIAGRQNISVSYLEQLMALLKKAGLVKSVRGAAGGYFLGRPAEEISVGDILRVLEGVFLCMVNFLSTGRKFCFTSSVYNMYFCTQTKSRSCSIHCYVSTTYNGNFLN